MKITQFDDLYGQTLTTGVTLGSPALAPAIIPPGIPVAVPSPYSPPTPAVTGTLPAGLAGETLTLKSDGVTAKFVHHYLNAEDWGAVHDGTTDDTTALNALHAAFNSAGGATIYLPFGAYKTTGALTGLTGSGAYVGDGAGAWSETTGTLLYPASVINCTSATAVLFTVTGSVTFRDIALHNTSGSASAGSAILVNGTDYNQKVDYYRVLFAAFYDCVDIATNSGGRMDDCTFWNPVHYGVRLRNTVNHDAGGFVMAGGSMVGSGYTGIRIDSSGGNKFLGVSIGGAVNAIDVEPAFSSSSLIIAGCSIENYTGDAIHLNNTVGGVSYDLVSIADCDIAQYGNSTGHGVYANGINGITIVGGTWRADTGTPTAISLNNGTHGSIGPITNYGFGTRVATSSFTDLIDLSAGAGSGTVTSVALTVPAELSVSGSPVTTSGTLAVTKATQSANTVWAGPTTGSAAAPTFRALVAADIPGGAGYHEVVMVSGVTPPDPVLNTAGDDWVYSS